MAGGRLSMGPSVLRRGGDFRDGARHGFQPRRHERVLIRFGQRPKAGGTPASLKFQKFSFSVNWTWRPLLTVLVIFPKVARASCTPGLSNWGVLKKLMNSLRKSSERSPPGRRKLLPNATFQLAVPSFRKVFMPRLPRPPGGILVSKYAQCRYERPSVPGRRHVLAPNNAPTVSGLSKLFPSRDGFKILGRSPLSPSTLP